ncbi:transposase-like protein [Vespula squamosa]|uniref:Transposase-like protein n=1 Tax=Vespula squamosa TaxID=30214 RepID=A0ABD2BXS3_VESSQ
MADMHLIYGFTECNSGKAKRLYANRFLNRRLLNKKTFLRLHERLQDASSFKKRVLDNGRTINVRNVNHEERILYHIAENDGISTQRITTMINLLQISIANQHFLSTILFTDEVEFSRDGIMNFHNAHHWAEDNPHAILHSKHQQQLNVNLWAEILGDNLIEPIFLDQRLTAQSYINFLRNHLNELLESIVSRFGSTLC